MPEIYRRLHLTKVALRAQIGFSMTTTRPIEFDTGVSHPPPAPGNFEPLKEPKNCDFLQIFYNSSV